MDKSTPQKIHMVEKWRSWKTKISSMTARYILCVRVIHAKLLSVYGYKNGSCVLKEAIDDEVLRMSTDEIISRTRLLENDVKASSIASRIIPMCSL